MSIEQQLDRLNANLEALVGAIAANTSVTAKATASIGDFAAAAPTPAATPAATTTASDAGKSGAGRPKTVYYRLKNGEVVKSSSKDTPVEGAVEITKAEYEEAQKPQPATNKTGEQPQSNEDPFANAGDAPKTTLTIDDVREVALKYRDKFDQAAAKALVAKYGVAKLQDLPAEKFDAFVKEANAAMNGEGDNDL